MKNWEEINAKINIAILFVSIFTLIVAIIGVYGLLTYLPGELKIHKPTAYGVIGGKDSFPSDLFFVSIPWENTGGQYITITNPHLKLERVVGNNSGEVFDFVLVGEMADISQNSFQQGIQNKFSITLNPHSRMEKVLVFQPEGFWNIDDAKDYYFTFKGGEEYRASMGYFQDSLEKSDRYLFNPQIFPTVDEISRNESTKYWYDFFPVEPKMIKQ